MTRIPAMVAVALILAGVIVSWSRPREPRYEGKPYSYWFKQWVETRSRFARPPEAFRAMGASVVPPLVQALQEEDSLFSSYFQEVFDLLPGRIQHLLPKPIPAEVVRWKAARALHELGPAAANALPQLMESLRDHDARVRSTALAVIGVIQPAEPAIMEELVRLLAFEDRWFRYGLARVLIQLDQYPEEAAPRIAAALIDMIRNQEPISPEALETLARLRPLTVEIYESLLNALFEQDQYYLTKSHFSLETGLAIREQTFQLLAQWTSVHPFARRLLYEKAGSEEEILRAIAIELLGAALQPGAEWAGILEKALEDPSTVVRFSAAASLHERQTHPILFHVSPISEALLSNNVELHRRAAAFVTRMKASGARLPEELLQAATVRPAVHRQVTRVARDLRSYQPAFIPHQP